MEYVIYTDGGCAVNPGGPGGYGIVVRAKGSDATEEHSQGYASTTNNRMEMRAALAALNLLSEGDSAEIHTDSSYVVNTMNGLWRMKKNLDLWDALMTAEKGKSIRWIWVKGHDGVPENERCDALATEAMNSDGKIEDEGYDGPTAAAPRAAEPKAEPGATAGGPEPEADGTEAFDGTVPEIRTETKSAEERGITEACAAAIAAFEKSGKSFRDFAALKTGGRDKVSGTGKEELVARLGTDAYGKALARTGDEKSAVSVLRWTARGLSADDAARKVLVDMEVAEKAAGARRKRSTTHRLAAQRLEAGA